VPSVPGRVRGGRQAAATGAMIGLLGCLRGGAGEGGNSGWDDRL
jgi:hypothetical protein